MTFKIQEFFNSISMIPGVIMSLLFMRHRPLVLCVPMIGYIITCSSSILFHGKAVYHAGNPKLLRLDLISQNIGLIIGSIYSPIINYPGRIIKIIYVATISGYYANLENENEQNFAFMANAINILIANSFNKWLMIQWVASFIIFKIPKKYTHACWHILCHCIVYQYFKECDKFQLQEFNTKRHFLLKNM
jgi:hypothetical protein